METNETNELTPPEVFAADLDLSCSLALEMHGYQGVVRQLLEAAARFANEGELEIAEPLEGLLEGLQESA